jgi:uncharacterized SAM-binding protein YcdF (DUF218 family)
MRLKRRLLLGLLLLAIALTVSWAMRPHLLRAMARWLDVGQPPRQAECLMILGGDQNTRPFVAAALVKAGFARHVLVTPPKIESWPNEMTIPPTHEVNRRVLLKLGIPSRDITILPTTAETTYDEAQALADFLRDRPDVRVLVVTSDFHTRRSRWVFARALGGQSRQVSFVSAPSDDFRPDCWWRDETGFVAITAEYLKLVFYVTWYGHFGYWLLACGGLALVAKWVRIRESRR